MTSNRIPLALLGVVLLVGCGTVRVQTDYDPATDFSGLRTYTILSLQPSEEVSDFVIARIERAIEEQLALQGIRKVPSAEASFLVEYDVVVAERVRPADPYYAQRAIETYEQGTIVIDFADPRRGDLLWRGTGEMELLELSRPEDRERRIHKVVAAILARFPPDPVRGVAPAPAEDESGDPDDPADADADAP